MADQYRIAEHFWRQGIKQFFLIGRQRVRNVHEVLMRINTGAANAGVVLQAKSYARRARYLAHQQCVGFDLIDIGRKGALDSANARIVRVGVDVDDRRKIEADPERA